MEHTQCLVPPSPEHYEAVGGRRMNQALPTLVQRFQAPKRPATMNTLPLSQETSCGESEKSKTHLSRLLQKGPVLYHSNQDLHRARVCLQRANHADHS